MQKLQKTHKRSHPVRMAVIGLAAVTLFSMTELGRHAALKTEAVMQQNMSAILSHTLEKENETTRMPVRFDDGLRAATTSGL